MERHDHTAGAVPTNSNNNPPTRHRPIKCTYRACGKYGHFTSQCWVAHPHLRPGEVANRGRRGKRADKGGREVPAWCGELTQGNFKWSEDPNLKFILPSGNDWHSKADDPWDAPWRIDPFPFLRLPQELQDKVYEYVYEKKHGVRVDISGPLQASIVQLEELENRPPELLVYGHDYPCLAQVSRKIREDSRHARKHALNGRMTIFWDRHYKDFAFRKILAPMWTRLRNQITEISFHGFNGRSVHSSDELHKLWMLIPVHFPHVSVINFRYQAYRYIDDGGFGVLGWTTYHTTRRAEEFAAGQMDGDFSYPGTMLSLDNLFQYMDGASHPCSIFLKTSIEWLNENRSRADYHSIKFLVTLPGLEVVERI
ncbi:uncharacterized protein Z519_05414 [Cladophialophora bantiana CBS 173.52]|uniref:Uncharacterized protein n=1 Tax=Cladophialophora bantiana (strain ATCC 10958 / CBS 173.52 / CDC B-1940 / NIH 8579) TaxID=1442370 RepID=A0A0D2HLD8_CLAB1|nr:uncharacterized protein Z519_05414 [Cladophialophora bantiana CBS 173.52]KIW94098.1 hypothetical protein Z519_05414 [Cladophialophora bantiana CBS 173.52]